MFSETGMDGHISEQLRKDLEDLQRENLSYREMKSLKKERKENFKANKSKLVGKF